jgi:hypothetical protein
MNTSLFLSRNESNSVSSFDVKSWEISAVLSNTLGSSGTCLVLHYDSIGLLAELPSFSFLAMLIHLSTFSSCKQFICLWSRAKLCSMFLAPFLLPWTEITLGLLAISNKDRGSGTLLQRC